MSLKVLLLLFTADAFQIYRKVSGEVPVSSSDLDALKCSMSNYNEEPYGLCVEKKTFCTHWKRLVVYVISLFIGCSEPVTWQEKSGITN